MKKLKKPILSNEPVLDGNEKKYLLDALKKNWISSGGYYTQAFESKFAKISNVKYALALSSGTSALHLALLAVGVGEGDEVIIPDLTIIASASTVIMCGAKPVLVDCDESFCLDSDEIEQKITSRTKAIMAVHLYGMAAKVEQIMAIAKKYNLAVIEDACSAVGTTIDGQMVGTVGQVGCFSFYATKTISAAEGGMLVTDNKGIADFVATHRNYASGKPKFVHNTLGFNYRIGELNAAIGLAQLEKLDQKIAKKQQIARNYAQLLKEESGIILPIERARVQPVLWSYPILLKQSFGASRDRVIEMLKEMGIETNPFFVPMSKQPVFVQKSAASGENISYPNSDRFGRTGLLLPAGLGLSYAEQEMVVEALKSCR